jgi:two-component system, OmpR family, phosphate regulon sensor histidine kinase PhoR
MSSSHPSAWTISYVVAGISAFLAVVKAIFNVPVSVFWACFVTTVVLGTFAAFAIRKAFPLSGAGISDLQAQSLVNDQINLLSAVLTSLREGVIVVDANLDVVLFNEAARRIARISGATKDDSLPGRSPRLPRLADASRDPAVHEAFRQALKEKFASELRIEFAGRGPRVFQLTVSPLEPNLAVGVFFDITELERLERVRREFFANLSHELRTPLTAIIASSETLLDGALDDTENRVRFIERLHRHAVWMSKLVGDISDLSAIESRGVKLTLAPARLLDMVKEAVSLSEAQARASDVSFILRVPDDLYVLADRTRLAQILQNLIDNAVKFNRRGGAVTVTAFIEDDLVVVQVSDTGIGIAAADLPRVFERLYRADKSRSRRVEGTGLGLAIVKHLVQAHGGDITVTSEVGTGSTFTFALRHPGQESGSQPVLKIVAAETL